jgi:hypothetical protein
MKRQSAFAIELLRDKRSGCSKEEEIEDKSAGDEDDLITDVLINVFIRPALSVTHRKFL